LTIIPIISTCRDPEQYGQLAQALSEIIRSLPEDDGLLLIASSDLSHFVPQEKGERQDHLLIQSIGTLNADALWHHLDEGGVQMCGARQTACVLKAARLLGATRGTLIRYGSSVHAGGDPHSSIGYGSFIVS
jgi:AmmeMemoRadiSam system protein B